MVGSVVVWHAENAASMSSVRKMVDGDASRNLWISSLLAFPFTSLDPHPSRTVSECCRIHKSHIELCQKREITENYLLYSVCGFELQALKGWLNDGDGSTDVEFNNDS